MPVGTEFDIGGEVFGFCFVGDGLRLYPTNQIDASGGAKPS